MSFLNLLRFRAQVRKKQPQTGNVGLYMGFIYVTICVLRSENIVVCCCCVGSNGGGGRGMIL